LDGLLEDFQVAVLDMAAVFAQVQRDAGGPAEFGLGGGPDRIGLGAAAGLPQRGYVVDIDAKMGHGYRLKRFGCGGATFLLCAAVLLNRRANRGEPPRKL
jgi:hypothetical protein